MLRPVSTIHDGGKRPARVGNSQSPARSPLPSLGEMLLGFDVNQMNKSRYPSSLSSLGPIAEKGYSYACASELVADVGFRSVIGVELFRESLSSAFVLTRIPFSNVHRCAQTSKSS